MLYARGSDLATGMPDFETIPSSALFASDAARSARGLNAEYYASALGGLPDDAYEKVMGANVRSNVWLCNMLLPAMAAGGGGAVILMSSIAGLKGSRMLGVYALSKAADAQLARNLAVEWGPKNVRANCLAPGIVRTDFAKALYENPAVYEQTLRHYPLGRLGEMEDVAGAAVFLASRAGAFVTGQTLVIDGGTRPASMKGFDCASSFTSAAMPRDCRAT